MNKSKIEWCDYTWNPVTGCLHGCEYCYARRQVNRFKGELYPNKVYATEHCDLKLYKSTGYGFYENHSIVKPVKNKEGRIIPYPFGFKPTFHRYRLDEPQKLKKPSKIFVVSMGDLFGEWVPNDWIEEVFRACEDAPQHKYIFLTKNPQKLQYPFYCYFNANQNWWVGTSITNQIDVERANIMLDKTSMRTHCFLSIEPLLGEVKNLPLNSGGIQWVIIGQQTGPGAKPPKYEWVQSIIDQCKTARVPVFVKPPLYEKFPIQQWPEGLE